MLKFLPVLLAAAFLFGCSGTQAPGAAASPASASSAVAAALADNGVEITGTLQAPKGFHGLLGSYRGRPLPVYVLPDGRHFVVGSLYDMHGKDLTSPAMSAAADGRLASSWKALQDASWVGEGNPHAQRVVYAFVDTRCSYCHRFWQASQPWIKRGDVQVRNILVGVIAPQSLPEAAAILAADHPAQAWRESESHFGRNKTPPATSPEWRAKVQTNNALMQRLGFRGTPAIIYKDADGHIHSLHGMPPDAQSLRNVFEG